MLSQDMIVKRGERAGQQVVQEANERAAREERLIRELEERKERETRQQMEARAAARAKLMQEVDASRKKQLAMKEQLKAQKEQESNQHVKEVRFRQQTSLEWMFLLQLVLASFAFCFRSMWDKVHGQLKELTVVPRDVSGAPEGRTGIPQRQAC